MFGSHAKTDMLLWCVTTTACVLGATSSLANNGTRFQVSLAANSLSPAPSQVNEITPAPKYAQNQDFEDQDFQDQDFEDQGQDFGQDQDVQDQDVGQDQNFRDQDLEDRGQDFGQDQDFRDQEPGIQEQAVGQDLNVQDQDVGQDQGVQGRDVGQRQPARQPAGGGAGVRREALSTHNQLRAQHCVPALSWSNQLAATAQAWANRCVFEHSTNGLGENLAIGTSGAFSPASQIRSWYNEINDYDFANGRSRTGRAVGHFTQVVWRSTTQVGCGVATCQGQDLLVCNYARAGNVVGRYVENVPQRCR